MSLLLTIVAMTLFLGQVTFVQGVYGQDTFAGACTISILNQTANVQPDGTWDVPNIPSNMGPVRARVTCVDEGQTLSGASEFFTITENRMNAIPKITLGSGAATPESVTLAMELTELTSVGQTVPANVSALFPDGASRDVTAASEGTTYASTNPEVASVDAEGLVTARSSGNVFISTLHDAILDVLALTVLIGGDSDGDGLPDDFELANGLNPNDPVDALEDRDRDGLVHLEEFNLGTDVDNSDTDGDGLGDGEEVSIVGTNPVLFDTDGDGLSDGLEIEAGTLPLDPTSFDFSAAGLTAFEVQPDNIVFVVDTLTLEGSRQLAVTGTLLSGDEIDLTSRGRGTRYLSSDLLVCNFSPEDGVVFAGQDGSCLVTVSNNGLADTVDITVESFAPTARASLTLPGSGENVDVTGDWAFIAAGQAGLLAIDLADRSFPVLAATVDTPGNANDVRVTANLAYVADGNAGLRIFDITNPAAPTVFGVLDTPGDARDVAILDTLVLVADGPGGVHLIDVANPLSPLLLASVALPGEAQGIDVDDSGTLAAVAAGSAGLHVIDLADLANPVLRGSLTTSDARDVDLVDSIAWLADFGGSLKSIDLSTPSAPRLAAAMTRQQAGVPNDIAILGGADGSGISLALTANLFFSPLSIPLIVATDSENPLPRSSLSFPGVDLVGQGIAVDDHFVYLTARPFDAGGSANEFVFLISQVLGFRDDAGLAPSLQIEAPLPDTEVGTGDPIVIAATAGDDIGVFAVRFLVDGEMVFDDRNAPFSTGITAPNDPGTLTISAIALDYGGNRTGAEPVQIQVVAASTTSVIGSVSDPRGTAVSEASVTTNLGGAQTTDGGGFFRFDELPADEGKVIVFATAEQDGSTLRGQSPAVTPVAGGFTDVGKFQLGLRGLFPARKYPIHKPGVDPRPFDSPNALVSADFNGDGFIDWAGTGPSLNGFGILLGKGDGGFQPVWLSPPIQGSTGLVAGDLNGDALADLVIVQRHLDQVSIFLNLGAGTFSAAGSLIVDQDPERASLADLDADGNLDLVVRNIYHRNFSIFLGQGDGRFGAEARVELGRPEDFVLGDANADGKIDLLIIESGQRSVSIFGGKGDGTFELIQTLDLGRPAFRIQFVDADGDGLRDIVTNGGNTVVLLNQGAGVFSPPVYSFGGSQFYWDFAIGDVNLDGFPDLATIWDDSSESDRVEVRLGDGSGSFGANGSASNYLGNVLTVEFGDTDLDGFPDLLVGGHAGLKVVQGNGSAAYKSIVRHPVKAFYRLNLMAAGDFNGDGLTDLVQSGLETSVHMGLGGGDFEEARGVQAAPAGFGLWVAEVTRDGILDIVTRTVDALEVLPGLGDGTFGPARRTPLTGVSIWEIGAVLGNFDGDGLTDFAVVKGNIYGGTFRNVFVMLNRGDGTFFLDQTLVVESRPMALIAADFNGDDRLDLAVTNEDSDSISVMLNQGGSFAPSIHRAVGNSPGRMVALDTNSDGFMDLVLQDGNQVNLRILIGHGDGTFTEGGSILSNHRENLLAVDVDQDGIEDIVNDNQEDDITIHLGRGDGTFDPGVFFVNGAWGSSKSILVPADLDNDGRLDFAVRSFRALYFLIQE